MASLDCRFAATILLWICLIPGLPRRARPVPEILSASETPGCWFGVNGPQTQPNGRSDRRESHRVRRLIPVRAMSWDTIEPWLEPDSSCQQREKHQDNTEAEQPTQAAGRLSNSVANDRSREAVSAPCLLGRAPERWRVEEHLRRLRHRNIRESAGRQILDKNRLAFKHSNTLVFC